MDSKQCKKMHKMEEKHREAEAVVSEGAVEKRLMLCCGVGEGAPH
jgi:hypothetical protein